MSISHPHSGPHSTDSHEPVELVPAGSFQPIRRSSRVLDVSAACGLLAASAPILGATLILVRLVDGTPVFYRGTRLGQGARPFTITKIRTLKVDAQSHVGTDLMTDRHRALKTRCGNFLRETRIDELPQLVNVLRGEMALFGPRPERPEIYEAKCRQIPGYADRFRVRPGLFGYSQILTPHGTPKRVRAIIDRRFVDGSRDPKFDTALLGLTIVSLTKETAGRATTFCISQWQQKIARAYSEQRAFRRSSVEPGEAELRSTDGTSIHLSVQDATDSTLRASGPGASRLKRDARAMLWIHDQRSGKSRRAHLRVLESTDRRTDGRTETVARYEPWSENSQYVIDQYLLNRSIVQLPVWLRARGRRVKAARSEA